MGTLMGPRHRNGTRSLRSPAPKLPSAGPRAREVKAVNTKHGWVESHVHGEGITSWACLLSGPTRDRSISLPLQKHFHRVGCLILLCLLSYFFRDFTIFGGRGLRGLMKLPEPQLLQLLGELSGGTESGTRGPQVWTRKPANRTTWPESPGQRGSLKKCLPVSGAFFGLRTYISNSTYEDSYEANCSDGTEPWTSGQSLYFYLLEGLPLAPEVA